MNNHCSQSFRAKPLHGQMNSTTELNLNIAIDTRIISAANMRIFTTSPSVSSGTFVDPFNISVWCASDKPNFNLTPMHFETVPSSQCWGGHGQPHPSQVSPECPERNQTNQMQSDFQSYGPWYRRSVPKSTKWCRATEPPGTSRVERLSRPSVNSDLPKQIPHTRARYRQSVPSETGQKTCANLQQTQ